MESIALRAAHYFRLAADELSCSSEAELDSDDLGDALDRLPSLEASPIALPPLGPTGTGRSSLKAKMYAHNRKVAARRRKAEELAGAAAKAPAPVVLPPLGPMGKAYASLKAKMYAHNRKVAAHRRNLASKGD